MIFNKLLKILSTWKIINKHIIVITKYFYKKKIVELRKKKRKFSYKIWHKLSPHPCIVIFSCYLIFLFIFNYVIVVWQFLMIRNSHYFYYYHFSKAQFKVMKMMRFLFFIFSIRSVFCWSEKKKKNLLWERFLNIVFLGTDETVKLLERFLEFEVFFCDDFNVFLMDFFFILVVAGRRTAYIRLSIWLDGESQFTYFFLFFYMARKAYFPTGDNFHRRWSHIGIYIKLVMRIEKSCFLLFKLNNMIHA